MTLLAQFLFRLVLGLAGAMGLSARSPITPGYFRNHSYVLLGIGVLLALIGWKRPDEVGLVTTVPVVMLSYAAAVLWLYEARLTGQVALLLTAVVAGCGLLRFVHGMEHENVSPFLLSADAITSGALLGATLAAMLLGHWYLNAPGMAIEPIIRITKSIGWYALARMAVCGYALWSAVEHQGWLTTEQTCYLALRWLFGLFGTLGLVWMTLRILKIPNTQAATGVLYVAVLATFTGEIMAMLLLSTTGYPL
jgi:hypothetical protein